MELTLCIRSHTGLYAWPHIQIYIYINRATPIDPQEQLLLILEDPAKGTGLVHVTRTSPLALSQRSAGPVAKPKVRMTAEFIKSRESRLTG